MFHSLARRGLRALRLQRARHPAIADIVRSRDIATVLDVGANDGAFANELREQGYRGRIVSFEPIAEIFDRLQARAARDPLWQVHHLALGDVDEQRTIAVSEQDVFSSLLPPTQRSADLWSGIAAARREQVTVERLDTFLARHPDYLDKPYLKIDTQGFELPVLRGAEASLSHFRCIQAELAFTPLYEGQEPWTEVIAWLAERGYVPVLAKENGVDWERMRVVEMDFVFERN